MECATCGLHLCLECDDECCVEGSPASPFIAARGGRGFTCVSLQITSSRRWGDSADPVEISFLVLGAWLMAWSFLWSVAEPLDRGSQVWSTTACPIIVKQ